MITTFKFGNKSIVLDGDSKGVKQLLDYLEMCPDSLSFDDFYRRARSMSAMISSGINKKLGFDLSHINVIKGG